MVGNAAIVSRERPTPPDVRLSVRDGRLLLYEFASHPLAANLRRRRCAAGRKREQGKGVMAYPGLQGKVVVVTGAAGGIGRSLVDAFVKEKLRVAALDIEEKGVRALGRSAAISRHGRRIYLGNPGQNTR